MTRVVLDTNVVVSAALAATSPVWKILIPDIRLERQFCLSTPLWNEYREVLYRPKFRLPPKEIEGLLYVIAVQAEFVEPEVKLQVSPDPNDDMVLELAQAANADLLITRNIRHFPVIWERTRVITPSQYVQLLDRRSRPAD
ncbi:MAG: putative toxin-antitoxin system toxin component, PIN family [Acidobacteria bacterium]|nr:putative toxin-antitoxin system toxin component, PIN family [Acidobacteriota bacterium]